MFSLKRVWGHCGFFLASPWIMFATYFEPNMEIKENDLKNLKCQEVANDLCLNIIKTKEFVWIPVQQRTLPWTQAHCYRLGTICALWIPWKGAGQELIWNVHNAGLPARRGPTQKEEDGQAPLELKIKAKLWKAGSSVGKESACNAGDPSTIPGSGRSTGEGIGYLLHYSGASLVTQLVKRPHEMWETWVQSLGWEDLLEKGKAAHSSILAWRIS